MTRPNDSQWVSISAYARIYGITRQTIHKWLRVVPTSLEHYRVGRIVRLRNQPPKDSAPSPDNRC